MEAGPCGEERRPPANRQQGPTLPDSLASEFARDPPTPVKTCGDNNPGRQLDCITVGDFEPEACSSIEPRFLPIETVRRMAVFSS